MKKLSLTIITLLLLTGLSFPQSPEKFNSTYNQEIVDSLIKAISKYYIFSNKAAIIGNGLKELAVKGVYKNISDPNELASQLAENIKSFHYDSHFSVSYEPDEPSLKVSPGQASKEIQQAELESNFKMKRVEVLPGNVGYFLFTGFSSNIKDARPVLHSALSFLANTDALIIDLRYNGGGSPEMCNLVTSYFFENKINTLSFVSSFNIDTVKDFTDPSGTNNLHLNMPVYILTSKNTFSGAEAFSYVLQSRKRATIVGDTTGGGAHLAAFFPIGKGFKARIPYARPINPITSGDWEGTGIIPNIPVPASFALIKAQEIIYQDLFSKSTTEKDQRKIQWAINDLNASSKPFKTTSTILNRYQGTYTGGLRFFVKDGILQCKNSERGGNDTFILKPVSETIFLLDEYAQIEFVKDSSGNYSSLNMLWIDGNITPKKRL